MKEARGDRMCQDALQELKMAIKASGEHKQRVNIQIAVDGLKIRDEKSGVRIYKVLHFCNLNFILCSGLSLSSSSSQNQFHSSGYVRQQSIWVCLRFSREWTPVLWDQDREGGRPGSRGHEGLVPGGL